LVIDASFALGWLYERLDPREAVLAGRTLSDLDAVEAMVPWAWHLEVINALLVGERRGLISEAVGTTFLKRLADLPILTDGALPQARCEAVLTLALARAQGLAAYDAVYLELALRRGATLATLDARLAAAMGHCGGPVLS
jgi:predicted nucleic acid-binding protein